MLWLCYPGNGRTGLPARLRCRLGDEDVDLLLVAADNEQKAGQRARCNLPIKTLHTPTTLAGLQLAEPWMYTF